MTIKPMVRTATLALAGLVALCYTSSAFASNSWTRLGGDPVTPGGLAAYDNGNARHGYVKLITSQKGDTAMKYAGLSKSEREKFVTATREGDFRQCVLYYGEHFKRMSFGINGTSVDRNVTFLDSRYRRHGAAAFCAHVAVSQKVTIVHGPKKLVKTVTNPDGSQTQYFDQIDTVTTKTCFEDTLVPFVCGNFAIRRHVCKTKVKHVHHPTTVNIPPPTPKPAYACVNLALSSNAIQTGQSVTATLTYTSSNGATFQSANIDWGDSSSSSGTSASHTYNVAGSYTVVGTVFFKLPNGNTVSSTAPACQKPLSVTPPSQGHISIGKVCEDDTGTQETCPTGTFTFRVATGGTTTTITFNSNPQPAGICKVGDTVTITENPTSGWQIVSGNPQTFTCSLSGVNAEFKNRQTPPPAAPVCNFNAVQEIDTSDYSTNPPNISTAPIYLHCTAQSGDVLSATLHAVFGTLSTNTLSPWTANGSDQVQTVIYTAPTEPCTETVSAHVLDQTTGKYTDVSVSFAVVTPPPPPPAAKFTGARK